MTHLDPAEVDAIRERLQKAITSPLNLDAVQWSDVATLLAHFDATQEEYAMWREAVKVQGAADASLIAAQERRIAKLGDDEDRLDLVLDHAKQLLRADVRTRKELDAWLLDEVAKQVA